MGIRFRRSIRIMSGVRLNVGKRGVSTSIGVRGAHVTIGKTGVRRTVGIPGTGLSWTSLEQPLPRPIATADQPGTGNAGTVWRTMVVVVVVLIAAVFVVTR